MRIGILGLGYVGMTSAGCLIQQGHTVVGIDPDEAKVAAVLAGRCPIAEPGLEALLQTGLQAGRLEASTEADAGLAACDIVLICVGTPNAADGSHDMSHVIAASRQVAAALGGRQSSMPLTVAVRSTMVPGSMETVISPTFASALGKDAETGVELIYNPEFMRETTAIDDYFRPARIVIGTRDGPPPQDLLTLYEGIDAPVFITSFAEAELIKLVDNSWHAVKAAYANEIGRMCVKLGVSATKVHEMFAADTKLNVSAAYTRPGGPFGGSCLPKDLRAFSSMSDVLGESTPLVAAAIPSNEAHQRFLFRHCTDGLPAGARILMIGLAFKPGTDDLRESPNVTLARQLIDAGYALSVHDPSIRADRLIGKNREFAAAHLPRLEDILVAADEVEAGDYHLVVDAFGWSDRFDLAAKRIVDIHRLR